MVGLSPLLHPRPGRLPPGLPGAGQALPLPPHHVSTVWRGSALPGLRGAGAWHCRGSTVLGLRGAGAEGCRGWGGLGLGGAGLRAAPRSCPPLSPQDAVLCAADPRPWLGLHGRGHGGGGGERGWDRRGGTGRAGVEPGAGDTRPVPPALTMSLSPPQGTSDFCVAPDEFIMNQTESDISAGERQLGAGPQCSPKACLGIWGGPELSAALCPPGHSHPRLPFFAAVVHYYLYCEQSLSNPFQQVWGVGTRAGGCPWGCPRCLGVSAGAGRLCDRSPLCRLSPSFSAHSPPCRSRSRGSSSLRCPSSPRLRYRVGGAGAPHPRSAPHPALTPPSPAE